MQLKIINPEKTVYDNKVIKVTLPGEEGTFQVLKNHAPIISFLTKGNIKVFTLAKDPIIFEVNTGIVKVNDDEIIVLL